MQGKFEVLQTSNPLTQVAVSHKANKNLFPPCENPWGVGAPPPTCTRKACVPLASRNFPAAEPLKCSLTGTLSCFFKSRIKHGRRTPPYREARCACFLCYFLHAAKSNIPSPSQGVSRFCKPRISSPKWRFRWDKTNSLEAQKEDDG